MYLEIDEGFPGHRKTLRLCALMRDPLAGWYMINLWTWACRSCKDGALVGMSPYEIEEAAKYHKHDGKLCVSVIDAGFIDKDAEGNPTAIHDWMKHTGGAIKRMDEGADRKKLYRLHRDGKCDGQTCQWCRTVPGQSQDSPRTNPRTSTGQTDTDKTSPDQSSPDKTSQERDSLARVAGAVPANEPGKPSPRSVVNRYLALRSEIVVGHVAGAKGLSPQPQESDVEKAATWLASVPPDACADIEPAIRLACKHVVDGDPGWNKPEMAKVGYLFGSIVRSWDDLREEIHGCAPKLANLKKSTIQVGEKSRIREW